MQIQESVSDNESNFYRKKLLLNLIIPGIFIFFLLLIKIIEVLFNIDLSEYGIYPLTTRGLPGIFFSPFIHADFSHLLNNSLPLFFLGVALFYFYSDVAVRVFILTYFLSGLMVWIAGRSAWHIGASGLVYGLASFLFFSGIIRRHFRLVALSLLIVFLYGSMVWGIFPGTYKNVSWESHMLGFFVGIVLAVALRKKGPQRPVYEWEEEDVETDGVGDGEIEEIREEERGERSEGIGKRKEE